MKRLEFVLMLLLVTGLATGCGHGKWRLRGAKCRPGMTMPTYAETSVPPPTAPPAATAWGAPGAAACAPGYPPSGFQQTGYPPANFVPNGYMPSGMAPSGGFTVPSGEFVSGETVVSDNAAEEFTTSPAPGQTQILQRPYFESPALESESSGVITVPGPETGPLPNG